MSRFRRINGGLVGVVAEGFFSRLSFGLVSFGLPLYALRLGMSLAEIGLLTSINLIVAIALKPVMGWVADRVGLKPSLTAAIVIRSLVSLLLVFAHSSWQLFAVRSLHGVSIALRDPAVGALIAELGGKKAVASSFAWYQTGKSVAGSLGKALAGVLLALTASSFPILFAASLVLSTIPLFIVVRFVPAEGPGERAVQPQATIDGDGAAGQVRHPPQAYGRGRGFGRPSGDGVGHIAPYVLLGLLISATAYMMANLFPILAIEYAGLNEAQTGAIYLIGAILALSGPIWGWLADNVSHRMVLSVRGIANVLSSVLYLVVPNFPGFAAGRALDDVGKAAFRPAWGALMARVASLDKRRRARVMAKMSAGEDAGEVIGPIVAGLLWSAWGVALVLAVRIILSVVTEVYTAFFTGSIEAPKAQLRAQLRARLPKRGRSARAVVRSEAARWGAGRALPDLRPGPGQLALRDVRLDGVDAELDAVAEPGGVTAVLVPDPATARAILNVVTGNRYPERGEVYLDGQALSRHSPGSVRRAVSALDLDPPAPRISIEGTLRRRWPEAPPEELARAWWVIGLADTVGSLSASASRDVGDLDLTTRWSVGLAAAIVGDPAVVVFDEAGLEFPPELRARLDLIVREHRGAVLALNPSPERLATAVSVLVVRSRVINQLA